MHFSKFSLSLKYFLNFLFKKNIFPRFFLYFPSFSKKNCQLPPPTKFLNKKINGRAEMTLWKCFNLVSRLVFSSYIDFLCNMLSGSETQSDERSSLSSASSSPAPCAQFQNGSTGSPIVPNEKLSYMFNVWRMEGEWSNSAVGKIEWNKEKSSK